MKSSRYRSYCMEPVLVIIEDEIARDDVVFEALAIAKEW